jgi:hypothetical protein
MEKKLFRVKVILYVMAENESEARVAALGTPPGNGEENSPSDGWTRSGIGTG